MLGKIICFFFGHKTYRLKAFNNSPMIQAIDPKEGKVLKADACLRCGVVHVRVEEYQDDEHR
jgi:hypothetical protein